MRSKFLFLSVLGLAFGLCLRTPAQTSIGVTPGWLRYLGDGGRTFGGPFSCPSGQTCDITDENWVSSFEVSAGATAVCASADGPIIVRSTGSCTVAGTLSNSPNSGGGGRTNPNGGINVQGDFGGGGGGGGAGATAHGHSGLWTVGDGWVEIADGGPPGLAPAGAGGKGETPNKLQYRPLLTNGSYWPAGGSIGGVGGGPGGGQPGNGGGPVIMVCQSINFTGTIDVSGGNGYPPTANNSGGGGGGGAGYVILSTSNWVANTGKINVTGGAGGSCAGFTGCGAGGQGGNGWSVAITIE
jgi:hypothetical protein